MKQSPVPVYLEDLPVILSLKDLAAFFQVGCSTLRRYVHDGDNIPRPFNRRPCLWKRDEVIGWLDRNERTNTRRRRSV